MNTVRTAVRKGFTLVEILIVVVILGILAAIVIPQFSSASQAAQASSLVTQLQSVRSQLELYQLQHDGDYPTLTGDGTGVGDFWEQLTMFTDEDGDVFATAAAARTASANNTSFGPYLQKPITNPMENSQTLIANTTAGAPIPNTGGPAAADIGFVYDEETGEIKAVVEAAVADEVNFDILDGDVITF